MFAMERRVLFLFGEAIYDILIRFQIRTFIELLDQTGHFMMTYGLLIKIQSDDQLVFSAVTTWLAIPFKLLLTCISNPDFKLASLVKSLLLLPMHDNQ